MVNASGHLDRRPATDIKKKPDVATYKEDVAISKDCTRYKYADLIFEFKSGRREADPFDDTAIKIAEGEEVNYPFEIKARRRKNCRGQIVFYARAWLSRQHRTHCYIVFIGDPHARIIRFDRSGGLVSAQLNYRTHSHLLLEFLWRFSQTSDEARNFDTTVGVLPPNDPLVKIVQERLSKWRPASGSRRIFEMNIQERVPKTVANVGSEINTRENSTKIREIYVWGALAIPDSVTGRATKGYPA